MPLTLTEAIRRTAGRDLVQRALQPREHRLFPRAVARVLNGGWRLDGRRFIDADQACRIAGRAYHAAMHHARQIQIVDAMVAQGQFCYSTLEELDRAQDDGLELQLHTHRHRLSSGDAVAACTEVEANRTALATLTSQGADLRDKHLKKALADLDKMEDTMFAALKKASESAGAPLAGAWSQVLEKMQAGGTLSGAQASAAGEQVAKMAEQMQGALKSSRAASMRAAQALAESYTAMVSGVLLGMSEALQVGGRSAGTKAKK